MTSSNVQFTFLGYTFRPRKSVDKYGRVYVNFSPAVSRDAMKAMRQTVRGWHLQLKCDKELSDRSNMFGPVLRGWANYYGRFYQTALKPLWRHVNDYLVRWMRRKYKRLARGITRAARALGRLAERAPRSFVHWEVHERESPDHASGMIEIACQKHKTSKGQITLHSDNGGPMKGATMLATRQRLGIAPSFSRPKVSDDNPYSESLFKTLKYCPSFPERGFGSIEEARAWVEKFVHWYNHIHLHGGINWVTPASRHQNQDQAVLRKRSHVYEIARQKNPVRWSKQTRDWSRPNIVELNPGRQKKTDKEKSLIEQVA